MKSPETTPRVGRWNGTGWLCECRESMYNSPEADVCHFCHAVRPPLPESSTPMTVTGTVMATIVNADGAQGTIDVVQDAVNALWRSGYKFLANALEAEMAALRAVPVEGREPVAWAIIGRDGAAWYVDKSPPPKKLQIITGERLAPLYAHPTPDGVQAERERIVGIIETAMVRTDTHSYASTVLCDVLADIQATPPEDRPDAE